MNKKHGMNMVRRTSVLILSGVLVAWFWISSPMWGLTGKSQRALGLILLAILWWVFKVVPSAYTSLFLIGGFILTGVAPPAVVLTLWTRPMVWLIISSFLLAAAVSKSGLAHRLAIYLLSRFGTTYRRMIVLIYALGLLLSFLIPQTFPRALMLMAVVRQVIQTTQCPRKTRVSLGFAVFSSLTATSMFLLTGDVLLNLSAVAFSGQEVSWLEWLTLMSIPSLAASVLMLGLHFLVFGGGHKLELEADRLRSQYRKLGGLKRMELVTLLWVAGAIIMWALDGVLHIDPAWVAAGAAIGLALPVIGDVLTVDDLSTGVSWPVIVFITGAFALGAVSIDSGLSSWLAQRLLPDVPSESPFVFASMVAGVTMGVHMLVGSALATMSVIAPALSQYAGMAGWQPLFPVLIVYTVVSIHFLLPFHNVVLLIGEGEVGGYGPAETLRFGLPMTLLTWLVVLGVEVPWWRLVGLI